MSRGLAALSAAAAEHCGLIDSAGALQIEELRSAVEILRRTLTDAGAMRTAVLADNGRSWVAADLALLACGATSIPIPTYFSPAQIAHVLHDASIDCVLTDEPERVQELGAAFELRSHASGGLALLQRSVPATVTPLPPGTAKITYTSGSTGTPKGVCLAQSCIEQVVESLYVRLHALGIQRHLCLLPLATLLENIAGVYLPLRLGATCCVPSIRSTRVSHAAVDPLRLLHCIDEYRPQSLILVPELLRVVIAAAAGGWRPAECLRFIAVGGARVSREEVLHAHALGLPVYEGYGLSECASVVCLNTPQAARAGSVGRALPHARLRIDAHGQLHVGGGVMNGYLGATPCASGEVATGDLAEMDDDGYVYIRGRAKNLIITSLGRNVSPEWIESELLRHPAIAQVMVVGEAQPRLGALIVSTAGAEQIEQALAATNLHLPDYARVRCWTRMAAPFTQREGLLTANGRLRRDAIAARHAAAIAGMFALPARCG